MFWHVDNICPNRNIDIINIYINLKFILMVSLSFSFVLTFCFQLNTYCYKSGIFSSLQFVYFQPFFKHLNQIYEWHSKQSWKTNFVPVWRTFNLWISIFTAVHYAKEIFPSKWSVNNTKSQSRAPLNVWSRFNTRNSLSSLIF